MKMWRPSGKSYPTGGDFLRPARKLTIHSITAYSQSYWHANLPLIDISHLFSLFNGEPTLLELTLSVPIWII